MKRFNEGEDRGQGTLLPELLHNYIAEDNPVRVVEVFIEELDLAITALVPKTKTFNAKFDGRFDKADFIDDAEKNEYRSPAGQALIWRFSTVEFGMANHRYWSSSCKGCALKDRCTPSQQRRVTRWSTTTFSLTCKYAGRKSRRHANATLVG